jgi:WD40 repeat protein
LDPYIFSIKSINDDVLFARSLSNIIIFGTNIEPYRISGLTISESILLENNNFIIGCKDGSIAVYKMVKNFEYENLVTFKEHCKPIDFLLKYKHKTLISGSADKIIIRDINKGLSTIVIINLYSQYLDEIIILDDKLLFSELGSLKRLI